MARTSPAKPPSRRSTLLIMLFGLPFLAVGLFMSWKMISLVSDAWRTRSWVETPAFILSVKLDDHGDRSESTEEVACRYRYHFANHDYEGTRVGLASGADNLGKWQKDTYRRLKAAYDREKPVTCYVNPHDPQQAVVDRQLRIGLLFFFMIFVVLFGGFGAICVIGSMLAPRSARQSAARLAEHPDEPWLHRPDWASGRIGSGLRRKELGAWALAVFWNAVSSTALFVVPQAVADGHYLALLFLLFPLIGLLLLAWAVVISARRRKFGASYLLLDTVPGVIGGPLRGRVCIQGRIEGLDRVNLALKCSHVYSRGSGDDRRTSTDVLWSDTTDVDCAATFGQTQLEVPIDFQIPHDCRPTENSTSDDRIVWTLETSAALPGADLALSFDVPVFRTAASDDRLGVSPQRKQREERVIAASEPPVPEKIGVGCDLDGSPEYRISCFPSFGFVFMFSLFAAACVGVAVFSWYRLLERDWFMLPFLLVFGGIGLLLVYALLTCFGSFHLTLAPGVVRVRRRWFTRTWQRDLPLALITGVELKQCASSGESRWYEIFCRMGGKPITLARNVPGELAARWIVRRVEEHVSAPGRYASSRTISAPPPV